MFVANVYRAQWKTFRHSWLDDEETPRHWVMPILHLTCPCEPMPAFLQIAPELGEELFHGCGERGVHVA